MRNEYPRMTRKNSILLHTSPKILKLYSHLAKGVVAFFKKCQIIFLDNGLNIKQIHPGLRQIDCTACVKHLLF